MYKQEFNEIQSSISYQKLNFDFRLFTAFSRQGTKKVYVQHLLREHGSSVWDLLQMRKGYFYICGDAKHMAVDVTKTLSDIAEYFGGMDSIQASLWIKGLRSKGRFLEDVWS